MSSLPPSALDELSRRLSARVEKPLGKGAFKEAFLVERTDERYALKVAPLSPALLERFDRESHALRGCAHPNIAVLHESFVFTHAGVGYWVSLEEYLAHGTLEERLAKGPLGGKSALAIGIPLAGALTHLRERGFVHRDIKPANILFRSPVEPVLTDFGIVRILGAPSLTHDFLMQGPGTPLFAAPEQLHNDKLLIDWRTDQFDLALVLAFAVLGQHPFQPDRGGPREAILAVADRKPLEVEVVQELTRAGVQALCRALDPWPIGRYQTPEAFIEALEGEFGASAVAGSPS